LIRFLVQITKGCKRCLADETMSKIFINNGEYETADPVLTGRDFAALSNKHPASDFVVVIAGNGTARALGLDERIKVSETQGQKIIIEKSDCIFRATLNEREFEWPRAEITGADIREFGQIPEDQELVLDSARDRVLDEDDVVKLSRKGVERFRTREARTVSFWVNGTEKTLKKGKYTFADIVRLAFPTAVFGGNKCYTVGWDQGPRNQEAGELFEDAKLRIIEGIIIDVSATDKS